MTHQNGLKDAHIEKLIRIIFLKVVRKAFNQGIISEKEVEDFNDDQKIDLIFSPNLSTKEQVSEISGRGIGMDVVKKSIEKIGGKIQIKTIFDHDVYDFVLPSMIQGTGVKFFSIILENCVLAKYNN